MKLSVEVQGFIKINVSTIIEKNKRFNQFWVNAFINISEILIKQKILYSLMTTHWFRYSAITITT